MITIAPILIPKFATEILPKSLLPAQRSLDSRAVVISSPEAIPLILGFNDLGPVAIGQMLATSSTATQHYFISFIIESDSDDIVYDSYPLSASSLNTRVVILSGNLDQWRVNILRNCRHPGQHAQFRFIANSIYLMFEKARFSGLWSNFHKIPVQRDGTFVLRSNDD